jgi:cell wall-associated NlpC family hydrolase
MTEHALPPYVGKAGDIYLTRLHGWVGPAVTMLQATVALAPSRYAHAGVFLGDGTVLSAQGSGARIDPESSVLEDRPLAVLRVPAWAESRRDTIVDVARSYVGHRYGWFAYAYIGLATLGIRTPWLERRIASEATGLICSALVDRIWWHAGIGLFDDGRPFGAVKPGELAHVGEVWHVGTGPHDLLPPN